MPMVASFKAKALSEKVYDKSMSVVKYCFSEIKSFTVFLSASLVYIVLKPVLVRFCSPTK